MMSEDWWLPGLFEFAIIRVIRGENLRGTQPGIGALDVQAALANIPNVKTLPMKVVGQLRKTPWQRFARLQATAALLAKGRGQRKGVFRFASHEECAQWTASQTKG